MLLLVLAMQTAAIESEPVLHDPTELQCMFENTDGVRSLAGVEAFHQLAEGPSSAFGESALKTMQTQRDECATKFAWNEPLVSAAHSYLLSDLAIGSVLSSYSKNGVDFTAIDDAMTKFEGGETPDTEFAAAVTALANGLKAQGLDMTLPEAEKIVTTYMQLVDFRTYSAAKFASGEGME